MTEDTSPENLRKFLESDDPGIVMMGLSMAKGADIPDEMLIEILYLYMIDDDKTIRAAAKSTFIKLAPEYAKQAVKENWKASYRTGIQNGIPLFGLGKAKAVSILVEILKKNVDLRKFLDSDDITMVRMGLSLAKGSGVPNDLLEDILWMYMMHDDKTIRAAAKSTFIKLAPEDVKQAVKENWKASYRADSLGGWDDDGYSVTQMANGPRLGILGKALRQTSVSLVGPLIKALRGENFYKIRMAAAHVDMAAAEALGMIGDERAVEPLIKSLGANPHPKIALVKIGGKHTVELLIKELFEEGWRGYESVSDRQVAVETLGEIGDKRAVESLNKILSSDGAAPAVRAAAADALGKIGDKQAVETLIYALEEGYHTLGKDGWAEQIRRSAAQALGKIGGSQAVDVLIKVLSRPSFTMVRISAAQALGNTGDKRAIGALLEVHEHEKIRWSATRALTKIVKASNIQEKKNIIKLLKSDDPRMVQMGASMLKGILEE